MEGMRERGREGRDSKVEGNIQKGEGMNVRRGTREGERIRDKERLVLTPVVALMHDLI